VQPVDSLIEAVPLGLVQLPLSRQALKVGADDVLPLAGHPQGRYICDEFGILVAGSISNGERRVGRAERDADAALAVVILDDLRAGDHRIQ
jgi:hypothetical protein